MQSTVVIFQNKRFESRKIIMISILFMEGIKVSQKSNKVTLKGFFKKTYIVPKKTGAILSYFFC